MFITVAWVGNRVIHLPSQLNKINQLDPKYLALGSDLNLNFAIGSAQADGYQAALSELRQRLRRFRHGCSVAGTLPTVLEHLQQL